MIQVLYDIETAAEITQKQLIAGSTNLNAPQSQREDYITLEEIFLHGGLLTWVTKTAEQRKNQQRNEPTDQPTNQADNLTQGPTDQIIRNHFNPTLQFNLHQINQFDKPGRLAWLITNHRQDRKGPSHCTAYLILFTNIDQPCVLREERIQNSTYGISYYNTLATIWKRCVDNKDTNAIIINSLDSSIKALENLANRSNIVIRLRELIVNTKTQIIPTDQKKILAILEKIRQQTSRPADLKLIKYCWPQVALRRLCNIRTAAINVQVQQRLTGQLTKTMKALCPHADCWAKIPLDQLSNQTIVMLTGLVNDKTRVLVRGELRSNQDTYPGCECKRQDGNQTTSTLVHRLTECTKIQPEPRLLPAAHTSLTVARDILTGRNKSISKTKLLKFLTSLVI